MSKTEKARLVKMIEEILNKEIPGTPRIGGRVTYVPLPGTGSKARHILSPRAQQVFSLLKKLGKGTSTEIQKGLKVNRNVVAGAVHELKSKRAIKTERLFVAGGGEEREQVAAEVAPRKRTRRQRKAGAE